MYKKKKEKLSPFAALPWEVINSPAFASLPGNPGKALPIFFGKARIVTFKQGATYSTFDFTYSEALKLGWSKDTFNQILNELHEKGFIDVAEYGGLRGCCRSNSKYKLSERWREYGKPNFELKRRHVKRKKEA